MRKQKNRILASVLVTGCTLLVISVYTAVAAPPANDDIYGATEIGMLPFTANLDTSEATAGSDPFSNCNYSGFQEATVWYKFSPTEDINIEASTNGSNYDTTLDVYTGDPMMLIPITCAAYESPLTFQANAGETYYFMIAAMGGGGPYPYPPPGVRDLVFNVQQLLPPGNDDFVDATMIPTIPYQDRQNLSYATLEDGELIPSCVTWGDPNKTIWYSYTPLTNILVTLNVSEGYSPFVGVYTGDSLGELGEVNCSTDVWSPIVLHVDANTTYYFQLGELYGDGGWTTFSLEPTHDVAITKFTVPNAAKAGQTRQITVGVKNTLLPETVQVELYKSTVHGYTFVGTLTGYVPVRSGNRTTPFNFSYTFTGEDALLGKVTFKAMATLLENYDALPADNEAISTPTKVNP